MSFLSNSSAYLSGSRSIRRAYEHVLIKEKHLITRRYTQRIQRHNLNFRVHLKRLTQKTI